MPNRFFSVRLNTGAFLGSLFMVTADERNVSREEVLRARKRALDLLSLVIGEAIQDYARVEAAQALLVEVLLRTDFKRAYAVFFAVQNIRSRNKLIETLLELEFKEQLSRHWKSCASFLQTLADFRNAVAHWHPMGIMVLVPKSQPPSPYSELYGTVHPVQGSPYLPLAPKDFAPFKTDCFFAEKFLTELADAITDRPAPLPEKFQRPIVRQNLAVLRLRRTAKAPPPQRQPSVPKLSAA